MHPQHDSSISPNPRICLLSQRNINNNTSRCASYEFEDAINEIDHIDLIAPKTLPFFNIGEKLAIRMKRRINIDVNPGLETIKLKGGYDLFIAICNNPGDLIAVNAIKEWKDLCKVSVCWIEEIWNSEFNKLPGYFKIMSKFDYVIVNCQKPVEPLQEIIHSKCYYMPTAIDSIKFCPYPNPPDRCIDVYSIGRRSVVTHDALLKMLQNNQIFYIYDSTFGMKTNDYNEHRRFIANIAKRSRYFIANYPKIDQPHLTHDQREIGFRFFEGAASGTVMLGKPPATEAFRKHFDWTDAVIHIPFNEPDIDKILADLDSQPERLEKIRKNNIIQSLLRHDWIYRWKDILDIVGLETTPAFINREKRLKKLAEIVKNA